MKIKKILFTLVFISKAIYADTYQASQGNNNLEISCDKNNNCQLQAVNHSSNQQAMIKAKYLLTDKTRFIWINDNIVELRAGVGSGFIYSRYFNFANMTLSNLFFNVSFFDPKNGIAFVESDTASNYLYSMLCVFNPKVKPEIILKDGVLDEDSIQQLSPTQVKFGYYDTNGNEQYQTITLNLNCNE